MKGDMMNQFYCYSKCSTCQKAKKYLQEQNIPFQEKEIKTHDLTSDDLKQLHIKSKLPLKKLFNTSGNIYKELNLKNKLDNMSLDEAYQLLASHGMLIKRPILIGDDQVLFGFDRDKYEEYINHVNRN